MAFLAQVVLQLAGYQSLPLAIILSVLIVVLAVLGGWPWIKRWRPFTLVSADGASRHDQGAEIERLEADKEALQKELDEVRSKGNGARQGDSASTVAQMAAERDRLREELESRKADAGARGKFAYD